MLLRSPSLQARDPIEIHEAWRLMYPVPFLVLFSVLRTNEVKFNSTRNESTHLVDCKINGFVRKIHGLDIHDQPSEGLVILVLVPHMLDGYIGEVNAGLDAIAHI